MKILSWNVRGLGRREKRSVIKDLLCHEKPDIVILQETKRELIDKRLISSIWGVRYKEWSFLPSVGRSGGIIIIWDVRIVKGVETILGEYSVSVCFNCVKGGSKWWLSGVYGPNNPKERCVFWEELAGLYGLCGDKWCIGGDFNVVRFLSEKFKGSRVTRSMRDFDALIREMKLIDPALSNTEFTWSNMRENLACSRIDRFLFTDSWGDMWQSIRQEGLTRVTSDHCPIILDTNSFKWGPTPFRFENMWLKDKNFVGKFKEGWEQWNERGWEGYRFMKKLEATKFVLRKWNKEEFGDIRIQKMQMEKKVEELDRAEEAELIDDTGRAERRLLKAKLEELIVKEEISWYQK